MRNSCTDCNDPNLTKADFYINRGKPRPVCISCWKIRCDAQYLRTKVKRIAAAAKRKRENPERTAQCASKRNQKLKVAAFEAYSDGGMPHCACCKTSVFIHLTIDHMNEDGAMHRRQIYGGGRSKYHGHSGGIRTYTWLKQNKYPPGFQVLCFNCNFAKHILGVCPCQDTAKVEKVPVP